MPTISTRPVERVAPGLTWITCRVCGLRSKVSVSQPALLCNPCMTDLELTRAHVQHLRGTFIMRLRSAVEIWDLAVTDAPADVRERWAKVEAARLSVIDGTTTSHAYDAAWLRARAVGGAFAALLLAWEERERIAEECSAGLERCAVAERELEALR